MLLECFSFAKRYFSNFTVRCVLSALFIGFEIPRTYVISDKWMYVYGVLVENLKRNKKIFQTKCLIFNFTTTNSTWNYLGLN